MFSSCSFSKETRSQNIVSNNTGPFFNQQGSEFSTQSTMYMSELERARQNYDPERVRQMSQMERVRHLSDIERARHLSETTAGTSVTGSSVTSGGVLVVRYEARTLKLLLLPRDVVYELL